MLANPLRVLGVIVGSLVVASCFLARAHRAWWVLAIPLVLVGVAAIVEAIKLIGEKRERKALIEEGVDPDTVAKKAPTLR